MLTVHRWCQWQTNCHCLCAWPAYGACIIVDFGVNFCVQMSNCSMQNEASFILEIFEFHAWLVSLFFSSLFRRLCSCYVTYTCCLPSIFLFPSSFLCVLCLYLSWTFLSGLSIVDSYPASSNLCLLEWNYLSLFLLQTVSISVGELLGRGLSLEIWPPFSKFVA